MDSILEADQADTFVFVRLEFLAVAEIVSAAFAFVLDDPLQAFLGANSADLNISFAPSITSVNVGSSVPVPEPSVIWLLLAGLPAAMLRSWRTRRATRSA